ncbi:hypothetical protein G6F65_020253 [Rhizopus arrhizus]|nr:hypothetical protein G6F65_020253 [Rhizopus arrhizus]
MLALWFPAACVIAADASTAHAQALHQYDLPAGQLDVSLTRIARIAGAVISFRAELVAGKSAPAISGQLTVEEATARALTGSGLELRRTADGSLTVAPSSTTTLAPVTVRGEEAGVTEGSASYTAPSVTIGGKLPLSLREIPQSVSVITRQRLEDQNMTSLEDAMAQPPGITTDLAATAAIPQFYSRGFQIEYFHRICSCSITWNCCGAPPACSTARASPAA